MVKWMGGRRLQHDTSISDINLFLDEPFAWFLKRFAGYRGESGPRAHLGTAVEYGLAAHLLTNGYKSSHVLPFEEPSTSVTKQVEGEEFAYGLTKAQHKFRQLTQGEVTEEIEATYAEIPAFLAQAVSQTGKWGPLVTYQRRIEVIVSGLRVVGYCDFTFADKVVDLKTTKAVPSEPREGHVRQVALYAQATGLDPVLTYVSGKKGTTFDAEDLKPRMETALYHVELAVRAIARIKRSRLDWRDMAELFPPRDMKSFRYDAQSRALIREVLR